MCFFQVVLKEKSNLRYRVLWEYATMATKQHEDVQTSVSHLLEIASTNQNSAQVLLALATGFLMLGQTPKARNQLKRIQVMGTLTRHSGLYFQIRKSSVGTSSGC